MVRAAGCVLWRPSPHGPPEVALVHRPRYDDWSFPKGKLDRGETAARAAVREVLEETGMACRLGARLPSAHYRANGLPKEVSYWTAEALGGVFVPNDEVDRLLWLPPEAAAEHLTHPRDRDLLEFAVPRLHLL
ncbi:NUDIX hydrolase [Streptomyces sparsus]